jgi:hypothetical protein
MRKFIIMSIVSVAAASGVQAYLVAANERAQDTMGAPAPPHASEVTAGSSLAEQIHRSVRVGVKFGRSCDALSVQAGDAWSCRMSALTERFPRE